MKNIVAELKKRHLHIGVMESCTGGAIASAITNIAGSSDVFGEGLVTYSNEAKIKYGVSKDTINKRSVFSFEVANEMARCVSGDIGVGVTGELPGKVYFSIRNKLKIKNYELRIEKQKSRAEMKEEVVNEVIHMVLKSL